MSNTNQGQRAPNRRTPEQDAGYDEAARGGQGVPPSDVAIPVEPGENRGPDEFDRAARDTADEVRRRERSG
jgi:hypothetical protein